MSQAVLYTTGKNKPTKPQKLIPTIPTRKILLCFIKVTVQLLISKRPPLNKFFLVVLPLNSLLEHHNQGSEKIWEQGGYNLHTNIVVCKWTSCCKWRCYVQLQVRKEVSFCFSSKTWATFKTPNYSSYINYHGLTSIFFFFSKLPNKTHLNQILYNVVDSKNN